MKAIRPLDTAALAAAIRDARSGIGIRDAWGTLWSREPPPGEYSALDLSGLDRVLDLSAGDLTCRVESGISHAKLASELEAAGLDWPLRPLPGQDRLAQTYLSGAAWSASALFPNPRDWILGSTLVSGRGETVTTGGATVKNSAGYDLARSCFGSMGLVAAPAQLQLRLRPRPQARAALSGPGLRPGRYLALLAEVRRQLDVVERFQFGRGWVGLTLCGPGDRVGEAAADLRSACPELAASPTGRLAAYPGWNGRSCRLALAADRMAGFLESSGPDRFWAFPLQRLAYSEQAPPDWIPHATDPLSLPVADSRQLRDRLELLGRGLDPERRFV